MKNVIMGFILATSLLLPVSCTKTTPETVPASEAPPTQRTEGVESTADIGFHFPNNVTVQEASFIPKVSKASAIATARDLLKTGHGVQNADEMAAKATVAVFQGTQVWIVVLDTPFEASGPPPPTDNPDLKVETKPLQFNVVVDADTSNVIYSVISGQVE